MATERKGWTPNGIRKAIQHYIVKEGNPSIFLLLENPTDDEFRRIIRVATKEGYLAEKCGDDKVTISVKGKRKEEHAS